MINYKLDTLEASEALIKDLYIDLRTKVNAWSEITKQTPQARMGYIGQHLVSIVTGYPGGKSGARGYDLVMENGTYGEIKTCYRVDQLGSCQKCGAVVSSLETKCSACGSTDIKRKDDSKWLISLKNDKDFEEVIEPTKYYFVLFEFEELNNTENNNIVASIWEVDPKEKGFAFCMIDYYLNIRPNSTSKAPFDLWPHSFKFLLTKPNLIYQSIIESDGTINTVILPSFNNSRKEELKQLNTYYRATTISLDIATKVINRFSSDEDLTSKSKTACLKRLEQIREEKHISNDDICDAFAEEIYLPLILRHKANIPETIKKYYNEFQ